MIRDAWEALSRALAVVRRRKLDREFDEEFATHLELLTEQNERRGLPRHEARRQAILQMGGLNPTRDFHRESRGLPRLERSLETIQAVGKDLRHAARSLARARAFTLVCVISLGVGMGSFVALVTFIRAMTSPARGIDTNGLVELLVTPLGPLRAKAGVAAIEEWSYPDFQELRRADTGMAVTGWTMGVTETGTPGADDEAPARVLTLFVSANYFSTFGVSLARGPGFDPAVDDRPSAAPRVVVSHGFWRNRLGSDPDIVGKTLTLDGIPHAVAGIAPAEFRGHFNALDDSASSSVVFMPLERHPRLRADPSLRFNRNLDWVNIHGRLAPGVDIARANAIVSATMSGLSKRYPATNEFKSASVEPYFSQGAANRREMRRVFGMILGLAGTVLLIVCVNISFMMLVRGATRERELSIREAVGASRRRLIQYLFFEAVWLALIGGGLSALVLFGIPAGIARWLGATVPPEFDLDVAAIALCGGLCLAVSVVLGLLPALRLSRPNLIPSLKDDAAGGGRKVSRVHRAAAAVQVAIAVPFLVISGVMLDRVRTADFGFETEGLVAARLDPAAASKRGSADFSLRSVRGTLAEASGVLSVTMGDGMPIDFVSRYVRVSESNGTEFVSAHVTRVAEGYLDTLGARLLRGRSITAEDRAAAVRVAVISEPLATRLFPNGDAIGERLTFAIEVGREEEFTIIGVSADFATSQLTTERPQILLPLPEKPTSAVYLIARGAAADETRLTSAFENVGRDFGLAFLPSRLGVFRGIVTGTQLVQKSLNDLVSESIAVAVAGGIVLVLASLGILGVIAFMVATRTREIAVRMALGATRPRVLGLMLSDVVKLVTPGVAVGLLVGAVLIRTMNNVMGTPLTVGSTPLGAVEPLIYMAAASVAVVVALLAGLPAARRAASVQPMIAMRSE
jgi:putative ABC transport system permease protein